MNKTKKYVYVFVRQDLPNPQKIVQASHAILEVSRNFLNKWEEHPSVLVIAAKSETQLRNFSKKIRDKGFRCIEFYEPLFENKLTSFAVEPVLEKEKENFKCFNLIRESAFTKPAIRQNYKEPLTSIVKKHPCLHLEYEVDYVETFAYEFTPKKICKRCKTQLEERPSEEEKELLFKTYFEDIFEEKPTENEVAEKKNGFNI